MPFGLTNAVACFQRVLNEFIRNNALISTFAYLDYVILCGMDQASHDKALRDFFTAAKKFNFTFNSDKCSLGQTEIKFLGYSISNGFIRPDADRLKPLKEYPLPNSKESLERAIGMLSYYSKWIHVAIRTR